MKSLRAGWIFVVASMLLVAPAAGGWQGVSAAQPTDIRPLYWQVDPDGEKGRIQVGDRVAGSMTTLSRDEDGISFEIRTTGLIQGHGYTVWFFSYDAPDLCVFGNDEEGTKCTVLDLFNPAAGGSLMWGRSGKFVERHGTTTFTGRRPVNKTPCVTEPAVVDDDCSGVLWGRGLMSPIGAEIHFVLRDHGPDQEGIDDETTTINGGCQVADPDPAAPYVHHGLPVWGPGWGMPGDYACYDPQGN